MKSFFYFLLWLVLAGLAILLAIVLGDRGAWYFAWLLGTVVIVLVAAAGGVLLDAQDERAAERRTVVRSTLPPH
jgi:predicted outer membrane lipoprotein